MAEVDKGRKTIVVVGLGMVGIGTLWLQFVIFLLTTVHSSIFLAFIEKLLDLDTDKRFRIVTCGEETHRKL